MKMKNPFLGFLTLTLFLFGLSPVFAQSSGDGLYAQVLEQWRANDRSLQQSRRSLDIASLAYAQSNAGLDTSWAAGLGNDNSGVSIAKNSVTHTTDINLHPYASLQIGDEHQSSISLTSPVLIQDGELTTVSPTLSLSHSITDLLKADKWKPDDLSALISYYQAQLNYEQEKYSNQADLLQSIQSIWTLMLQRDDQSYKLTQYRSDRQEAVDSLGYAENSSHVLKLDYQISSAKRSLDFTELKIGQQIATLNRNSSLDLSEADIRTIVAELGASAGSVDNPAVPKTDSFSTVFLADLQLRLAESELNNTLEADPLNMTITASATATSSPNATDSADKLTGAQITGGMDMQLGDRLNGSFTMGYDNDSQSPFAELSIGYSSDSQKTVNDLKIQQLRLSLENRKSSLQDTRETALLTSQDFENQGDSIATDYRNALDQLASLNVQQTETALAVQNQVASQSDLDDINEQINQLNGQILNTQIDLLILRLQIQAATAGIEVENEN